MTVRFALFLNRAPVGVDRFFGELLSTDQYLPDMSDKHKASSPLYAVLASFYYRVGRYC